MVELRFIKNTPNNKIGDIAIFKNKKGAQMYVEDGICEYTNKPKEKIIYKKTKQKKNTQTISQKKKEQKDIYEVILNRHRSLANPCYINIFAGDDQKKQPKIYSYCYNLHEKDNNFIKNELEIYNTGTYAVFMNFNLLEKPQRKNDNITKILYVFVDLDDANEHHNALIKENLEKKGITYTYNALSGHGSHFLIPVDLEPNKKDKVKGFLTYLKHNICDKVDIATHTNERLIRAPESLHNKDKESKKLVTLYSAEATKEEIENNNTLVLSLQEEQKKGVKDEIYAISLKKDDLFFSRILNHSIDWKKSRDYLNNSTMRNNIFLKNLGIFLKDNVEFKENAYSFIANWEKSRFPALQGWVKKASSLNMSVNYIELFKWAKENNLKEWEELLKEQLKESFLDEYEIYYLEDEKIESNCLLFFSKKNYYVQKSIQEVILNIFYDCKEKGIDLVKELNLKMLFEKWEEFSFKKQMMLIQDQIRRVLEKENRIKKVFNINYEPSENKFIHYNNKVFFNTYTKSELWDYYKKQKKYHFPKIKELMLNLCNKEEEYYNYFCKWLAWQIKNPDIKLPTAIIMQGRQGSGKGTFKDLILDNIFGDNCQEINQTDLECSFNDYLLGKQIIVANEVMHNENRQTLPNVLKNLVTDKKITIKRKFLKSIVGQNFTHWIFCTNSDNPIKIEEDDRRYTVLYSEKLRKGLAKEIRENLDYELKDFISYLKDLDVNFEEVSEPLMTEAKKEIIELNKDSVEKFTEYLKQFNDLNEAYISIYGHNQDLHINESFGDGERYILTEKIYLLYERWCEKYKERGVFAKQNFSKRMSNKNIKPLPKWLDKRTFRMYNIKDLEALMMR